MLQFLHKYLCIDLFFPFLVPALTTFFDDEHLGHFGGIVCSKSERSVGRVLFLGFDVVFVLVELELFMDLLGGIN